MISTEGCFMFRHDRDIMELNNCVASHPVELGQVFNYKLSRKTTSVWISVSYFMVITCTTFSAVALSLFYFHHLCPSVTISIWSSDCILDPKCWFQFENIWFLWIKDKYGRENCYDNARLISWILLFFVGPWLSLKFEGALMYYLHSSPKGCCQSFELILNQVDMYSLLIKIWNVDIRKIHSVLIIYNFYESWEGKNPTF